MPLHPDFQKIKNGMTKQYGEKKGAEVYYSWLNKHGYDDSKPLKGQKSKAGAEADDSFLELFDDPEELERLEPNPEEATKKPLAETMDKKTDSDQYGIIPAAASAKKNSISIGAFKTPYIAAPKFEGKDGPIIVKAVVLEEGANVNGWRVVSNEFQRVGEQYKAGRQLRLNHDKTVQSIIGKSFNGAALKGADIPTYMGANIEGINPDGLYVVAEFEANPQDPQVRTNILQGYCEYGSIGLDANAYCDKCGEPVQLDDAGGIQRSCHDLDAAIKLMNVEVKEYSYVAEPAYQHSVIVPSFTAAVSKTLGKVESSLSNSPIKVSQEMSAPNVTPTASVTAKKAESEGEGEGKKADADALAIYKMGYADALKHFGEMAEKFRAKADDEADPDKKKGESDATVSATASAKTDQIGKVAQTATTTPAQVAKAELLDRVYYRPTEYMAKTDPAIIELFTAAVKHPDAPPEIKARFKGMIK